MWKGSDINKPGIDINEQLRYRARALFLTAREHSPVKKTTHARERSRFYQSIGEGAAMVTGFQKSHKAAKKVKWARFRAW